MSQAYNLIGEDAAVQLTLGANSAPAAADFTGATAVSIIGTAKRVAVMEKVAKVNVKGMGDLHPRNRFPTSESSLEIEKFTSAVGFAYEGKLGQWIKLELKEISSASAFRSFVGVIVEWTGTLAGSEGTTEKITIDLNPDVTIA